MTIMEMSVSALAVAFFASGVALAAAAFVPARRPRAPATSRAAPVERSGDMSEAAFAVADCLGVAAFKVDRAGRILSCNRPGRDQVDVPDALFLDLFASESRASAMASIAGQSGDQEEPMRVRLANGRLATLRAAPTPGDPAPRTGTIAFLSEETGRAELAVAEDAVITTGMAGAVLATVSHELRTPLNAIIGFSGILEQEIFGALGNSRQREYVSLIQQSGHHLLAVVNELLDVSKLEAGRYELRPERFTLGEIIDDGLAMVRCEAMQKGLDIDFRDACTGMTLLADRRALKQMILNLVANAVKFTDDGLITVECRYEGDDVVIAVSDTGIGIPADQIAKLGNPFVQASCGHGRHFEGTGLGLAYVRGMAELHGGRMDIKSEEGSGTVVTLRFPAAPSAADPVNDQDQPLETLNHASTSPVSSSPAIASRRSA